MACPVAYNVLGDMLAAEPSRRAAARGRFMPQETLGPA